MPTGCIGAGFELIGRSPLMSHTSNPALSFPQRSTDGLIATSTGIRPARQQRRCILVVFVQKTSSGATLSKARWASIGNLIGKEFGT